MGMDDNEATDLEIMKQTIALLLSFASMAAHVATRSYLVRCVMLWFLRRAEASGQRYVTGLDGAPSDLTAIHRNSRAEALRLARSFRRLAHTLKADLRREQRLARLWAGGEPADTPDPSFVKTNRPPVRPLRTVMRALDRLAVRLQASRVLPPP